jgi:hypothetical protein
MEQGALMRLLLSLRSHFLGRLVFVALTGAAAVALVGAGGAVGSSGSWGPRLTGTVGPGRTISLADGHGGRVRSVRRGSYRFVVRDRSSRDNFHLLGPSIKGLSGVTGIQFRGTVVWKVRLAPGTYRYRSDGHPKTMHGTFHVT